MIMKKFIRKNRSMSKLVVINEEELIQQVSIRPALYNRSLKANRKAPIRLQLWLEVSEAMDASVEECRKRWRSLRDSFSKHYKRMQRSMEDLNKQRKWMFYDQMSFLIPYLDSASYELQSNIFDEIGDNSEDAHSIVCEPIVSTEEQAIDKELQTNEHDEPESHKSMDAHDEHIYDYNEQIQQATVPVQATDSRDNHDKHIDDHSEQIQQATVAVQATDSMNNHDKHIDDHSEQIQQTTVAVQATDCMYMQEDSAIMENNVHYNPSSHQHMMRSDFSRHPVMNSEEKFLLSCAPALHRLTNRQKALARLKIQQILYDIEFGQQENN